MVKEIVQHGHCHACGRAVKWGDKTCSETCKQEFESRQTRMKRNQRLTLVLLVVAALFFVVIPLIQGLLQ